MSNRIDLTQYEKLTEDGLRGGDTVWRKDVNHEFTVSYVLGLIAELKRCYKLLDDADYARSRYGEEEEHQDIDNVADAYEAVCIALDGQGR